MVLHKKSIVIISLIITGVIIWKVIGLENGLSLAAVQNAADDLKLKVHSNYLAGVIIFMAVYIAVNLWFPAAAVLTLLAGFLFGTIAGTIYILTAAIIASVMAFEISRQFAGNWIQHKWKNQLKSFNEELSQRGYVYLLLVRLIPMMPYFLINFLSGLTKVHLRTFVWTTALGSLPGVLIFSYAGKQLLSIKSIDQVVTLKVVIALALVACFVILFAVLRTIWKRSKGEIQNVYS